MPNYHPPANTYNIIPATELTFKCKSSDIIDYITCEIKGKDDEPFFRDSLGIEFPNDSYMSEDKKVRKLGKELLDNEGWFQFEFRSPGHYVVYFEWFKKSTGIIVRTWDIIVHRTDLPEIDYIPIIEDLLALYTIGEIGIKTINKIEQSFEEEDNVEEIYSQTELGEYTNGE